MTGPRTALAVLAGAGVCFGAAYAGGLAIDGGGGRPAADSATAAERDGSAAVVPIARPSLSPAAELPALKAQTQATPPASTPGQARTPSSTRASASGTPTVPVVRTAAVAPAHGTTTSAAPTRTAAPAPTQKAPARQTPASQAPAQRTPARQTPAQSAPVQSAPVQSAPTTPVSRPAPTPTPAPKANPSPSPTVTFFDDGG
ncbi:MAG TPA: hypothetical protein VFG42_25570 [Baekduia sp.]|uniref:hypothetical protein n=1 Tax=Baekduia sp. TaxID=2600305 RepID=UPI002D79A7C9|nr:hypothetical protein [Baekduia sp.]HET6510187.1 hypothetical protein [Baekduia sp.]